MKNMKLTSENLTKSTIVLLVILTTLLLLKCKKEDTVSTKKALSNITIMTNANDPLLLTAIGENNEIINIYGEREEGLPISATQIEIYDSDTIPNLFLLDDENRPTKFIANNGVRFDFEWINNSTIALTVISADGETQLNTEVDLTNDSVEYKSFKTQGFSKTQRKKGELSLVKETNIINQLKSLDKVTSDNSCKLYVTKCGELVDADVRIDITTDEYYADDRTFLRSIYPKRITAGVYEATIPSNVAPSVNPADVCSSISNVLDNICLTGIGDPEMGTVVCTYMTAALTATVIGAAVAAEFFTACELLNANMILYCQTIGQLPPGTSLCDAEFLNFEIVSDIKLRGVGIGIPYHIYGYPVSAPGEGPYPNLELDLGSETQISGFYLQPSKPSEGQNYLAIAKIFCVKTFSSITISIVGTDGYEDSISFEASSDEYYKEYVLSVPGAERGVRDVCTLEITLLDGTVIKRTASLVFGN